MNRLLMMGRKRLVPGYTALYLCNEGAGTTLTDYSGNGYHGTLGTGGAAPTWTQYGLAFNGGQTVTLGLPNRLFADPGSPFTVTAVVYGVLGPSAFTQVIVGRAGTTYDNQTLTLSTLWGDVCARVRGTETNTSINVVDGSAHGVTFTTNGTSASVYVDALGPFPMAVGTAAEETARSVLLGARGDGGAHFLTGTLCALVIHPFELTRQQLAQNLAYLKTLIAPRGLTLSSPASAAVAIGDSITVGFGIAGVARDRTYPHDLQVLLGAPVVNAGIGGNSTAQMAARLPDLLTKYSPPTVMIGGGTVDVSAATAAATIIAGKGAMVSAVTATSARAVLLTIPPCSAFNAAKNDIVATVNAWIASQASSTVIVADIHAALKDPANPTALLAAYDSGDAEHPSQDGLQAIADTVYAAI